jgi:hypothetical protein
MVLPTTEKQMIFRGLQDSEQVSASSTQGTDNSIPMSKLRLVATSSTN